MDSQNDRATHAPGRSQTRQDWLLDEALAETFPASDPISPSYID